MKVTFKEPAKADIIRQYRYYSVEQDAPEIAARFRQAVLDTADWLKENPAVGRPYESSLFNLRSWPVKGFEFIRIYYSETKNRLTVLRLLHGKRDLSRLLRSL